LYFTAKTKQELFILNLDCGTFTVSSTKSGAFMSQPDQLARTSGQGRDSLLYFCEDSSKNSGVHGRDPSNGRYFTILQSGDSDLLPAETTGLAFSPDSKRMYVSFQKVGKIFEVRRTDGGAFGGQQLGIKYHTDPNDDPFLP
jgi:secreted PhoX family phosphatase